MPVLVIQQGHCYRKTGATGTEGEQAYSTHVANACVELLHGRGGWSVRKILADDAPSLYRGDAFVAIHCDGSIHSTARGASVGYQNRAGQLFAQAWKREYDARGWDGFRADNYTPSLHNYYGVTEAIEQGNTRAFIAECGFLTNPDDRRRLTEPGGPKRVAAAIGAALGIPLGGTAVADSEMVQDTAWRALALVKGQSKQAGGPSAGDPFPFIEHLAALVYRVEALVHLRSAVIGGPTHDATPEQLEIVGHILGIYDWVKSGIPQRIAAVQTAVTPLAGQGQQALNLLTTLTGMVEDLATEVQAVRKVADSNAEKLDRVLVLLEDHTDPPAEGR